MDLFPRCREVPARPGRGVAPDRHLPWAQAAAPGVRHVIATFGAIGLNLLPGRRE